MLNVYGKLLVSHPGLLLLVSICIKDDKVGGTQGTADTGNMQLEVVFYTGRHSSGTLPRGENNAQLIASSRKHLLYKIYMSQYRKKGTVDEMDS